MAATPSVSRSRRLLALLACLLGVASIIFSYFYLPLYLSPFSIIYTTSGWDWASGLYGSMVIQGVSPSFLFGIGWALTPLVAAIVVGVLGIARFASAKPALALLYLIVCLLGAIVLGFTFLIVIFGLRIGALGEAAGYALCFWADYLWRGKRPAYVNIWKESA